MSSKSNKLVVVFFGVLIVLLLVKRLFFFEAEIKSPTGWPDYIKSFINHSQNTIRVFDEKENVTIFIYDDDPLVRPKTIEKVDSRNWNVTFERV